MSVQEGVWAGTAGTSPLRDLCGLYPEGHGEPVKECTAKTVLEAGFQRVSWVKPPSPLAPCAGLQLACPTLPPLSSGQWVAATDGWGVLGPTGADGIPELHGPAGKAAGRRGRGHHPVPDAADPGL